MMLYPHALARLRELMEQSDASVPLMCAALWDCDVERPVQDGKIYRHEIVDLPFNGVFFAPLPFQMNATFAESLVLTLVKGFSQTIHRRRRG